MTVSRVAVVQYCYGGDGPTNLNDLLPYSNQQANTAAWDQTQTHEEEGPYPCPIGQTDLES